MLYLLMRAFMCACMSVQLYSSFANFIIIWQYFFVKFNTFTLAVRAFMCACMSVQLYSSFVNNIIILL